MVNTRKLGQFDIHPIGLGCMNVSHAYGPALPPKEATDLLNGALDEGYNFLDTATLYGLGGNETLIGEALKSRRDEYVLASKCVLGFVDGKRVLDGRPETIKSFCDDSLRRLQTDHIDLYYLHRLDKNVPIEESVGALGDLVAAGKIRSIGLSEMSADTLRRAEKEQHITAMQTEYSLWTRNPEIAVLEACKELGVTFVAFSPVARGFLADKPLVPESFHEKDIRNSMPRFDAENYDQNLRLLSALKPLAAELECTISQLGLAWVLSRGEHIVAIPGTQNQNHMRDNFAAAKIELPADMMAKMDDIFTQDNVQGHRYSDAAQKFIDTESFA